MSNEILQIWKQALFSNSEITDINWDCPRQPGEQSGHSVILWHLRRHQQKLGSRWWICVRESGPESRNAWTILHRLLALGICNFVLLKEGEDSIMAFPFLGMTPLGLDRWGLTCPVRAWPLGRWLSVQEEKHCWSEGSFFHTMVTERWCYDVVTLKKADLNLWHCFEKLFLSGDSVQPKPDGRQRIHFCLSLGCVLCLTWSLCC